jgi:hypothetical protein
MILSMEIMAMTRLRAALEQMFLALAIKTSPTQFSAVLVRILSQISKLE